MGFREVATGQVTSAPADHAVAITPSDVTSLAHPVRGIYVGTTGDVTVLTVGGETVTFVAVPAGAILPVAANRVNDTGTDAEDLVGLY